MKIAHAFRLIFAAAALMWLVSTPGEVGAQVSLGMSGGLNVCLPNGAADCEDIYPIGYVNGAFEYRFLTYVAVGLDYNFSGLYSNAIYHYHLVLQTDDPTIVAMINV